MWPERGRHAGLESQTRERMLPDSGRVRSGIRQSSSGVMEGRSRRGRGRAGGLWKRSLSRLRRLVTGYRCLSKPMMLHLKRCLYCMKSYYDEADLKRHCVSSHRASGAERWRPGSDKYVQSHQLWSVSSRKRSGPGRGRDQGSLGEQRECHRRDGRQPGTRLPPRHKRVCLLPKQQVLSIGKKREKADV